MVYTEISNVATDCVNLMILFYVRPSNKMPYCVVVVIRTYNMILAKMFTQHFERINAYWVKGQLHVTINSIGNSQGDRYGQ